MLPFCFAKLFLQVFLAVRTGLEPATPGVTGRYSNQLNYRTNCSDFVVLLTKGTQRYNFFRFVLHLVDIFLGYLIDIGE